MILTLFTTGVLFIIFRVKSFWIRTSPHNISWPCLHIVTHPVWADRVSATDSRAGIRCSPSPFRKSEGSWWANHEWELSRPWLHRTSCPISGSSRHTAAPRHGSRLIPLWRARQGDRHRRSRLDSHRCSRERTSRCHTGPSRSIPRGSVYHSRRRTILPRGVRHLFHLAVECISKLIFGMSRSFSRGDESKMYVCSHQGYVWFRLVLHEQCLWRTRVGWIRFPTFAV